MRLPCHLASTLCTVALLVMGTHKLSWLHQMDGDTEHVCQEQAEALWLSTVDLTMGDLESGTRQTEELSD